MNKQRRKVLKDLSLKIDSMKEDLEWIVTGLNDIFDDENEAVEKRGAVDSPILDHLSDAADEASGALIGLTAARDAINEAVTVKP